jgi:hypothetical protein
VTGPLKTWMVAAIAVAVLLVAGLPALAVTLASRDGDDSSQDHRPGDGHGLGKGQGNGQGHGLGKHLDKKDRKALKGWMEEQRGPGSAWKSLTPAQKAKKMAELSREHADAMKKWADCVAAGQDECERPLPPGLAKRR